MPARKGNTTGLTHGVHSFLDTGQLPQGASWIKKKLTQFRIAIQSEVQLAHGSVSVYQACLIQTACRFETVAQLWQRWLRIDVKNMTVDQQLSVTRAIASASKDRDAALKELGLNRDERKGAIDALFTSEAKTA